MKNELCTSFVEGDLDEELVHIEVVKAGSVLVESSYGRLFMSPTNKLTLHLHAPSIPGNFPTKDYGEFNGLQVVGTTRSGWKFNTLVFLMKPLSYLPGEDMAVWSMEPFEVVLQRTTEGELQSPIRYSGLIDKIDCLFDKSTTRMVEGSTRPSISLDWSEIKSAEYSIRLYRGDSTWSILEIEMQSNASVEDFNNVLQSFLNALSLRMGKRVDVLATKITHGRTETSHLAGFHMTRLKHTGNNPIVPLVMRNNMGSNFLMAAMEFFRENQNSAVINFLYSVWDAELVSRENHRLQLAIALEGFSKYVNKLQPGPLCTPAEVKRKADEEKFSKLKDEAVKLIDSIEFDEGHRNRLKNVVKRASLNDSGPMIRSAGECLGINFMDDELKCWRSMRHAAAHGDNSTFDETESDFFALQSMLYRLVLRLVGWSGPVVPYGQYAKYVTKPDHEEPVVQTINLSTIKAIRRVEDNKN
ncbi:MAG: hypothetical protein K2Y39_06265 [Candidatus Obscuribacterales bacterium]|nr:hypothetical protein [Candidatus Obscuribacterales bacterium]